jgi:hypothetical protein
MPGGGGVPSAEPRGAKEYSSFLIRWWRLRGDERRLEVEHIQSGQRTRVASPAEALAWMGARERSKEEPAELPPSATAPRQDRRPDQ